MSLGDEMFAQTTPVESGHQGFRHRRVCAGVCRAGRRGLRRTGRVLGGSRLALQSRRFPRDVGRLGWRVIRGATLAVALVLAVGLAAGTVRLLPWLLAPEVPLRVALPFARALGASATEIAFLVGAPIGAALVVVSFIERGEARSLMAVGASPLRLTLSTFPHLALVGLAAFSASLAWGSGADVPGRFARQLIHEGRSSCAGVEQAKSASVPLLGVTWLCFPGQPPRITGALPGLGGRAWFSARELEPSDDLRELRLVDMRVVSRRLDEKHYLDLSVQNGTVRGLPGWGRSAKLPLSVRSALSAATAVLLALGGVLSALRLGTTRRVTAIAVAGVPVLASIALQSRLDAGGGSAKSYLLVPVVGVVTLVSVSAFAAFARARLRQRARPIGP